MIRSKIFWIGAVLLAVIPILLIDLGEYYVAWQKEVLEPIIEVVQNFKDINSAQKADILDTVFEKNQSLIQLSALKGGVSIVFLLTGIYLLRRYAKTQKPTFLKPAFTFAGLVVVFIAAKILLAMAINTPAGAKFITVDAGETSFKSIIGKNFKGKVVYVDFWGTTCGPCLLEFANFTHPVKDHYKARNDIAYLYISGGNRYLWKKQIEKFHVTGSHLFLEGDEYEKLYRDALSDNKAEVLMPHYLIINKQGNIAVADAARPSDYSLLTAQLDRNLK
ncbi:thiol-disulfide isomerase/thioredoxin [Mucilaginibacter sp. UYNi724]